MKHKNFWTTFVAIITSMVIFCGLGYALYELYELSFHKKNWIAILFMVVLFVGSIYLTKYQVYFFSKAIANNIEKSLISQKGKNIEESEEVCPLCGSNVMDVLDDTHMYCMDCGHEFNKKKSRGDKIRSMTDEEIADGIFEYGNNMLEKLPFCKGIPECGKIVEDWEEVPQSMCRECLMEWIQSPYE